MNSVAHVDDRSDFAELTTVFLDSAAAIENRLHESNRRIQSLQREVRRAQQQQVRIRQWIVMLRRSHRTQSHAKTAKLIKGILAELAAMPPLVSLEHVTTTTFPNTIAS